MKVIKSGDIERTKKIKTFECEKCGCVFQANKGEYSVRKEYNEIYFFCKCPSCKEKVYISE